MQDLDGNAEDNVGAEEAFKETDWEDVSEGYNSRQRKKVELFFLFLPSALKPFV